MAVKLEEIIDKINRADDPAGRTHRLPDDALIEEYERSIGITFLEEYKRFLKSVSNAFVGFMSPFTLSEDPTTSRGDLIMGVKNARRLGVPRDWLPICEDNGDYYCLTVDGTVRFWDHSGQSIESWPDIATWAEEVWLEGQ